MGTIDQWLSPRGRGGTIKEKWGAVACLVFNLVNAMLGRRSWCWAGVGLDNLRPYAVGLHCCQYALRSRINRLPPCPLGTGLTTSALQRGLSVVGVLQTQPGRGCRCRS